MAERFYLTRQDRDDLSLVLNWFRQQRPNEVQRASISTHKEDEDYLPPEVYIVEIPSGGIGARSGTDLQSGVCDVYRMNEGDLGSIQDADFTVEQVYNLSTTAATAGDYSLVKRDKYGRWYIEAGAGGGGGSLTVEELDGSPSVGSVDTLVIDQDCGLFVTAGDPGEAILSIQNTSSTTRGVIALANQTIGTGLKQFQDIQIPIGGLLFWGGGEDIDPPNRDSG